MLRLAIPALALVVTVCQQPMAAGQMADVRQRFAGTWTANLSKSTLDPRVSFQGVVIRISVGKDAVTIDSDIDRGKGDRQRGSETLRTDGTETRGTLTAGVTHHAGWVGPDVLVITARKDDQRFALVTYELSPDGRTLTTRSSGMLDQVVVFDRQ